MRPACPTRPSGRCLLLTTQEFFPSLGFSSRYVLSLSALGSPPSPGLPRSSDQQSLLLGLRRVKCFRTVWSCLASRHERHHYSSVKVWRVVLARLSCGPRRRKSFRFGAYRCEAGFLLLRAVKILSVRVGGSTGGATASPVRSHGLLLLDDPVHHIAGQPEQCSPRTNR